VTVDKSHLVITHTSARPDGEGWAHFGVLAPDGTLRPLDVMVVTARMAENLRRLLDDLADSDAARG
jgi:hypothetical protein